MKKMMFHQSSIDSCVFAGCQNVILEEKHDVSDVWTFPKQPKRYEVQQPTLSKSTPPKTLKDWQPQRKTQCNSSERCTKP